MFTIKISYAHILYCGILVLFLWKPAVDVYRSFVKDPNRKAIPAFFPIPESLKIAPLSPLTEIDRSSLKNLIGGNG